MRPIAVTHQSARNLPATKRREVKTKPLWLVKNWADHPIDPGWDDGIYCICHTKFRNASSRQKGEIVLDCVNDGKASSKGYIVRSYFKITDFQPCKLQKGRDLLFTSYYFCDGQPFRLKRKIGPSGVYLNAHEWQKLKSSSSYKEYLCSSMVHPSSINKSDWIKMIEEKKNEIDKIMHEPPINNLGEMR